MSTGENIRKIRRKKGLTQKQLGELCSIDEANIRRYELGNANPKLSTIRKIAKALDVYMNELIEDWSLFSNDEIKNDWSYTLPLEDKLKRIKYSLGWYEEDAMIWINYPDGTLEVRMDDLKGLDLDTDEYLRFKLEQFKQEHIKDFKPYKK